MTHQREYKKGNLFQKEKRTLREGKYPFFTKKVDHEGGIHKKA